MDSYTNRSGRSALTIDDVWRDERPRLLALASRMLRDPTAAQDAVQDAFGRLTRVGLDEIDDPAAWLTVVVRRLCLTRLGSAYARRESAVGALPPEDERAAGGARLDDDPADRVSLDDQVQRALAVVLDELSPAERTSFVLHDVFGLPYGEIGELVGRTSTACRQLASRARRTVRGSPSSSATSTSLASDEHRRLVGRFAAACSTGDLAGLVDVLDPDVGSVTTTLDGVQLGSGDGADHVATQAIRFLGPASGTTIVPILGESGVDLIALYADGRRGVIDIEVLTTTSSEYVPGPNAAPETKLQASADGADTPTNLYARPREVAEAVISRLRITVIA